jgi:hypothetical protein
MMFDVDWGCPCRPDKASSTTTPGALLANREEVAANWAGMVGLVQLR